MSRGWLRHMCYLYRLITTQKTSYLFNSIPPKLNSLRHCTTYTVMRCRNYYSNMREWNKLSIEIQNSTSYQQFRKSLFFFTKPASSALFSIHCTVGVKLVLRLRLGFRLFCENKFRHSLHDALNPVSPCTLDPKITSNYLLCCHNFSSARLALMNYLDRS